MRKLILTSMVAAIIVATIIIFNGYAHAVEDVLLDAPASVYTTTFISKKEGSKIDIKWSKSYEKNELGQIIKVKGYDVQYGVNKDFENSKQLTFGNGATQTTIKLPNVNTPAKYKKLKYYVRVRAYASYMGFDVFKSKWNTAKKSERTIKAYYPIKYESFMPTGWGDIVVGKWNNNNILKSYLYRKTDKYTKVKETNKDSFKYPIHQDETYTFNGVYCKTLKVSDPSKYDTSVNAVLYKENDTKLTAKYKCPKLKAEAKIKSIDVSWDELNKSNVEYYLEYATQEDFSDKTEVPLKETKYSLENLPYDKTYYIRVKATYGEETMTTDYSDVSEVLYETPKYKVKFNGNGNTSGKMKAVMFSMDKDETLPENKFKRDGYEFVGWSLAPNDSINLASLQYGTVAYENEQTVKNLVEPDKTITLYACWKGNGAIAACDWARIIANDDSFMYGSDNHNWYHGRDRAKQVGCYFCGTNVSGVKKAKKDSKWDKTYCCNSFVMACYTHGANWFNKCLGGSTNPSKCASIICKGQQMFKVIGKNTSYSSLKPGDIMCRYKKGNWTHIKIYIGNNQVAHAAGEGWNAKSIRIDNVSGKIGFDYTALRLLVS